MVVTFGLKGLNILTDPHHSHFAITKVSGKLRKLEN